MKMMSKRYSFGERCLLLFLILIMVLASVVTSPVNIRGDQHAAMYYIYKFNEFGKSLSGAEFKVIFPDYPMLNTTVVTTEMDEYGNPVDWTEDIIMARFIDGGGCFYLDTGDEELDVRPITENIRFTLQETKAPEGHILNDKVYEGYINPTNYELVITNSDDAVDSLDAKPEYDFDDFGVVAINKSDLKNVFDVLSIKKIDDDTKEELHGWEFELTDMNGNLIKELTEKDSNISIFYTEGNPEGDIFSMVKEIYCYNANGEKVILIDGFKSDGYSYDIGEYEIFKIKETKAPEGYIIKENEETISLMGIADSVPGGQVISYGFDGMGSDEYDDATGNRILFIGNKKENQIETINISGKKTWDDEDNKYQERPDSIEIILKDDNDKIIKSTTTNAYDNWEYEFTDVPKYHEDGVTPIEYHIEEGLPWRTRYDAVYNGFDITNKHRKMRSVYVQKNWFDGKYNPHATSGLVDFPNKYDTRPESIEFILLANGKEIQTITVAGNKYDASWRGDFDSVPIWDEDGKIIEYTCMENYPGKGYRLTNDGGLYREDAYKDTVAYLHEFDNDSSGHKYGDGYFYFSNAANCIKLKKTWDDNDNGYKKRPDSVTVKLFQDNVEVDTVILSEDNNWECILDYPMYDFKDNYRKINYRVEEVNNSSNYSVNYKHEAIDTSGRVVLSDGSTTSQSGINYFEIINEIDDDTEIKGTKTWDDNNNQDGKRPESITVNLLADGEEVDEKQVRNIGGTWEYEFKNVPKYDKDGKEIIYTITEDAVEGYEVSYDGFNIINKHEPETVRIKGEKVWYDFDNKFGTRPESITVILSRGIDGEPLESLEKVVTAADNWEYDFGELPKYLNGKEIYYHFLEKIDFDGFVQEYGPMYWYRLGYYDWDLGRYDVGNLLRFRTKDITIKKTDIDGNLLPNTKFDIYAYAHVGMDLSVSTNSDLMYLSPWAAESLANPKYNTFPIGGYGFGSFVRMSSPFMSEFVRRVHYEPADELSSDFVYIYTPLLKFKDGTTLLDYFNENNKMPEWGEYKLDDIDYEATEWYAINMGLLPDFIDIEPYDYRGLYDNDIWIYMSYMQNCESVESLDSIISESQLVQIKELYEKMSMGRVWLSGNPVNTNLLSETMRFKVGEFTTDKNGEIVLEDLYWTNRTARTEDGHIKIYDRINPILEVVETETSHPKYELDDTIHTIDITKDDTLTIVNNFVKFDVNINKTDMNGVEIEGAEIKVIDSKGNLVKEWISKANETMNIKVAPGDYIFTETVAPSGYAQVTSEVKFNVSDTGEVKLLTTKVEPAGAVELIDSVIVLKNDIQKFPFKISKRILGGEEVAGATMIIKDASGNEVMNWVSDDKGNHEFELPAGEYVLIETASPEGLMKVTTEIQFEVTTDGKAVMTSADISTDEGRITLDKNNHFILEDKISPKEVVISKTDMATGKELPGATLKVINENGDVVKEWVSTDEPMKITLDAGKYILREETAPDGYLVAEKVPFEVDRFGLVGSDKVEMQDAREPKFDVKINKTDLNGNEIEGALIKVTGKDFEEEWISKAGEVMTMSVKAGTYKFVEVSAPTGYIPVTTEIEFTVSESGEVNLLTTSVKPSGAIEMIDGVMVLKNAIKEYEVEISKIAVNGTKELPGAELKIESSDVEGFETIAWTSGETSRTFILKPGTYTMTETTAPDGYEVAESITFIVTMDGKVMIDGSEVDKVVMKDAPKPEEPKPEEPKPEEPKPEEPKPEEPKPEEPAPKKPAIKTQVKIGDLIGTDEKALILELKTGETSITKDVTDIISYTDLDKGYTYKVEGTLVEVENGSVVREVAKAEMSVKADSEKGNWELAFKDVSLSVNKVYVVFEKATPVMDDKGSKIENGKPIIHADVNDKSQTIVTIREGTTPPSEATKTSVQTGVEKPALLIIDFVLIALGIGTLAIYYHKKKKE